ncbi:MAG TPA: hypothetical protein VFE57_09755 [Cyclobacteriaceae bacterium]|nr:hypothetical protein [Cyclobacteriaceae bacterium]
MPILKKRIEFQDYFLYFVGMVIRFLLVFVAFCFACQSGEIPCATGKPLKLKKMGHYGINPVKKSRPVASAEKAEAQRISRSANFRVEVKELASLEEWDCPKPGMNKPSKAVQQNIKANKKKINAYYKNRFRSDSVRLAVSISQ